MDGSASGLGFGSEVEKPEAEIDMAPTPTLEARLVATKLAPLEEHIGAVSDWPLWLRDLALKDSLNVKERFALTVNLIGNVCPGTCEPRGAQRYPVGSALVSEHHRCSASTSACS